MTDMVFYWIHTLPQEKYSNIKLYQKPLKRSEVQFFLLLCVFSNAHFTSTLEVLKVASFNTLKFPLKFYYIFKDNRLETLNDLLVLFFLEKERENNTHRGIYFPRK